MGNGQGRKVRSFDSMTVFLIPRDFLLDPSRTYVPPLQEMRGHLHQMELTVQDIADGIEGRLREVVVVSHRHWVVKGRSFYGFSHGGFCVVAAPLV